MPTKQQRALQNRRTKFDTFQHEVGSWANETFPMASKNSIALHMEEELSELRLSIVGLVAHEPVIPVGLHSEARREAADLFLLLLHLAHKMNFSLFNAANEKFILNKDREWETEDTERGYWKHIERS